MACSESMIRLINRVIDGEASKREREEFEEHIQTCETCRAHYEDLKQTIGLMQNVGIASAPDFFTQSVMAHLPTQKRQHLILTWLKRHPLATAAACFIILMGGYIVSMWQQAPFNAYVNGSGKVAYADHNTAIVPKGKVIKGDLVVQNGKVKIEGKVEGDVILINSDSMLASAGQVTGHIKEVDEILGWIWYHIKHFFQSIFFITASQNNSQPGVMPGHFHMMRSAAIESSIGNTSLSLGCV